MTLSASIPSPRVEPSSLPIGVFDSGLGGLTVARAIIEALPEEALVYLGDTARVPYGTRSARTVLRYARTCARHLRARDIKLLVVACNTVSAIALEMLRVELDIPVLGVIEPGASAGVRATRTGRIGVLATAGTVASGAYPRAVAGIDSRAEVFAQPAPLLVPLAEEGWVDGEVPMRAVERYLEPLAEEAIDTLVLGCTHYPLLLPVIRACAEARLGSHVQVVDSAHATAAALQELLLERGLGRSGPPSVQLLVTDRPAGFQALASRFLGTEVDDASVEQVDL